MSSIEEEQLLMMESREAIDRYSITSAAEERAMEIKMFTAELSKYGLSIEDLTNNSPKHRDTRKTLFNTALICSRHMDIIHMLKKKKMLPIKEIQEATGAKRKFLEQWRKYIMALIIIVSSDEYLYLKEYIDFDGEKEGM